MYADCVCVRGVEWAMKYHFYDAICDIIILSNLPQIYFIPDISKKKGVAVNQFLQEKVEFVVAYFLFIFCNILCTNIIGIF